MLLLVGLGNPGKDYAGNRHNIGFRVVDAITRRYGFPPFRSKFQGDMAEGTVAGVKVLALKPQTYMNESGRSVLAAATFYKIPPEDILVLHDELDLDAGKIRVKPGGGLAGHNGLKSIKAHLGPDFRRLRLGIGHPGDKDKVTGHVLKDFAKADEKWLVPLMDAIADEFPRLVEGDNSGFMSRVALALAPPKEKKAAETGTADSNNQKDNDGS